ncbi:MAG TPA: hypothetical protein V6C81_08910 [Planktothrix sp.]|jgi:hypothetical protein
MQNEIRITSNQGDSLTSLTSPVLPVHASVSGWLCRHAIIPTDTTSSVVNSQEPGIGRVARLGDLLAINNLGRNIQFCRLTDGGIETVRICDYTLFPGRDDETQFDLDCHAIVHNAATLFTINHYGVISCFPLDAIRDDSLGPFIQPIRQMKWPGDVECIQSLGQWLIGTSPRGFKVIDHTQPGIIVADVHPERLRRSANWRRASLNGFTIEIEQLPYRPLLLDWGYTTALACDEINEKLAVAAGNRVGVFALSSGRHESLQLLQIFEQKVPFAVDFLQFTECGGELLCAGYGNQFIELKATDWDAIGGGGWMKLSSSSGKQVAGGLFPVDLAWGNGGVPLALSENEQFIYAADKHAGLHRFDINAGTHVVMAPPTSADNVGLAHMDRCGLTLVCGFNRDGYKIHTYSLQQ